MSRLDLELQQAVPAAPGQPAEADFRHWAERALPLDEASVELVIRIVDEAESGQLNRDYRGKEGPTNVLSFPFEAPPEVPSPLLGDLVICAPVVAQEAAQQGKSPQAHWAHMVIHGVLHLLGYDHMTDEEAQLMEDRERELLHQLHFPDPYNDEDR